MFKMTDTLLPTVEVINMGRGPVLDNLQILKNEMESGGKRLFVKKINAD